MADQEKGEAMTQETTEAVKAEIVEAHNNGEVPPTRNLARTAQDAAPAPMTLFGTTNPREVIKSATETAEALTEILEEKKLYKDIRDRRHVLVEGWTLLGSLLGVFPVTIWTRQVEGPDGWRAPKFHTENRELHSKWCDRGPKGHPQRDGCKTYDRDVQVIDESGSGGWEARVEAHTLDGKVVGTAEAECRWDEWSWRDRDSHALRSMAQTRATAKALRLPLGFIVELAGFSATPAEELTDSGPEAPTAEEDTGPVYFHKDGHPVYDNRGDAEKMEQNWPAFKCKVRDCTDGKDGKPWATWDKYHFADPDARAKHQMIKLVEKHRTGWKIYYELDAPDYTAQERTLLEQIHEADDATQMAGFLWNRLEQTAGAGLIFDREAEGRPNQRDFDIMVRAAEIALVQAEEDAAEIILELEALEQASERIAEDEAERMAGMSDYA